jgi:hypothetical protein
MPGGSKKRIWTSSGSVALVPTWNPASKLSVFRRWRATAEGRTRRSATCTPVELIPAIIARLTTRHAAGDSRLATTRAPRLSAVPRAAASRTPISGVRSTLTSPVTPPLPKSREDARDSQITLSWICVPDSTSLYG